LISYIAAYAVAIPLALSGGSLWSLLSINLVASVFSLAGIYVVCRQRWPEAFRLKWRFDSEMARTLVRQGLPTGLSHSTIASIVNQFDTFLVSTFVSYELGGLYDRAYRIASWPNLLVTTIVSRIGFLTFSKVRSDPARLAEAVQLAMWGMGVLSVPLALGLFFGASDIIQVLYGTRYVESGPFLRFLGLYSLVWPFVNLGFWLAAALGHGRATIGITVTQALTIVILGLPLTIGFGVTGTLIAVGATMLVAFGVSNVYIFRQVPIPFRSVYWGPGAAGLAGFVALWLVQQTSLWAGLPPLFRLVVIGMMIVAVFGGVLFLLEGKVLQARLRYVRQLW
jgi:PST family polysaccharide transporter